LHTSGVVGMSSRHFDTDSDLFIMKMKSEGVINQAVFSMLIGTGNKQSKMTLGGYREDFFIGDMSWHTIDTNSVYW
jgi:hypothetical protein